MAKFLTRAELYRILQRELPEGVYPDGAPSAFFSTADMDSIADVAATGYYTLNRIYDNYFPQTADEKMTEWEVTVFGNVVLESLATLQERRDRVIRKIRLRRGITKNDMLEYVADVIGEDKEVEIIEWGCSDGGWMLDHSQLGVSTYLNAANLVDATGEDLCSRDPSEFGKTEAEWLEAREQAYTYEVRIYNYTLTADELSALDELLTDHEPARSGHVIVDSLTDADKIEGDT